MAYCFSCGVELDEKSKFCQACGAKISILEGNKIDIPVSVETKKEKATKLWGYTYSIMFLNFLSFMWYTKSADWKHFKVDLSRDEVDFAEHFLFGSYVLVTALIYWLVVVQALKKSKPNFVLYGAVTYGLLTIFGYVGSEIAFGDYNRYDWLGALSSFCMIGLMLSAWNDASGKK